MSELPDPAELARQQQLLFEQAGYGLVVPAMVPGTEPEPLPPLASAEQNPPLPSPEPPAIARIALEATFDASGILLESAGKTRRVDFLPKGGAVARPDHREQLLTVRRDTTWAILNEPGKIFSHIGLHPLITTERKASHYRIGVRLYAWWDSQLRINGRSLIVPVEMLPLRPGAHTTHPRLDITARQAESSG